MTEQTTTRIYMIRHGATQLSAEDRFAGAVDVVLSEGGETRGLVGAGGQSGYGAIQRAKGSAWWPSDQRCFNLVDSRALVIN